MCFRTEEPTRKAVISWVEEMMYSKEPFFRALGELANPSCVKYGYCPDRLCCGYNKTDGYNIAREELLSYIKGENNGQT